MRAAGSRRAVMVIGAALVVAVAACSSDGKTTLSQEARQYAAKTVTPLRTTAGLLSEEQARCVGESWVRTIGLDRLTSAGITPEQLGSVQGLEPLALVRSEADQMASALSACDVDLVGAMQDQYTGGGELDEAAAACFSEIRAEDLEQALAANILGEDAPDEAQDRLSECLASS